MTLPNVKAFSEYDPKRFTLIPLHLPKAKRKIERKGESISMLVGKRPLHNNWTTAPYSTAKVIVEARTAKRNVGVRLKPDQLVIDVDPRNGGEEGFADLCMEVGLKPEDYPTVRTGSGGLHLYMTKPADMFVVDTIEGFPGVEFKSKGRQVLAAGCVHPETGNLYVFEEGRPNINTEVPAPANLLRLINRVPRPTGSGGGHVNQEKLAKALAVLDPTQFREHDEWLHIMMAAHHATGGEGRSEFIEWSTSDPEYSDHAELIGRRWDSLHVERQDGYTVATINHYLAKAGHRELMLPTRGAKDDFDPDEFGSIDDDDDDEFESKPRNKKRKQRKERESFLDDDQPFEPPSDPFADSDDGFSREGLSYLENLNRHYVLVNEGGRFNVLYEMEEETMPGRTKWHRWSPQNFCIRYGNVRLERDPEAAGLSRNASNSIKLGQAWLEWSGRDKVTFDAVTFDPSKNTRTIVRPNGFKIFNMWTGWGMEASPKGSWNHLQELIFEAVCGGNDEYYNYLMNWCRFMFQKPNGPGHVAVVMRGGKGVGKGTFGTALCKVIGRHALHLSSKMALTERFNAHMQDAIFLFSDEAVKPNDSESEGQLKRIITEETIDVEKKGVDKITTKNFLHIMMASNDDWIIPASMDERRFFMTDVKDKYKGNTTFFKKLRAELGYPDEGDGRFMGLKRMMFDMLNGPLDDSFHPAKYPETPALRDQKIRSLDPVGQFIWNQLYEGVYQFQLVKSREPYRVRAFNEDIRGAFSLFCAERRINPGGMGRGNPMFLFDMIARYLPSIKKNIRLQVDDLTHGHLQFKNSDGRALATEFPEINHARAEFESALGHTIDWPATSLPESDEFESNEFEPNADDDESEFG